MYTKTAFVISLLTAQCQSHFAHLSPDLVNHLLSLFKAMTNHPIIQSAHVACTTQNAKRQISADRSTPHSLLETKSRKLSFVFFSLPPSLLEQIEIFQIYND